MTRTAVDNHAPLTATGIAQIATVRHLQDSMGKVVPRGKFFCLDGERFLVKGVTYGTFAPNGEGYQLPAIDRVARDCAMMSEYGINTVRVYTVPSREFLDEAAKHGLRVMVGMPWAQHVAFLDDAKLRTSIRRDVQATVRSLGDHPGVLMFALGNEIPASIVRWHGRERIEGFLRQLYEDAKSVAPESTLTYVNFPPTEYLELSCLDVCAFNVYLHDEVNLRKYVARLQHIAGNKPLLLAEAGADSIRHGEEEQARLASMQLRASFEEGACGAISFAWTDDWWRGGYQVENWSFGLVDADRRPKPALDAVADVFADAPFGAEEQRKWPKVSVVICAYNAASTLDDCLSSLARLTYPNFEVVIVNDGSTDATGEIARHYPRMRLIEVPNGGLSLARNIGVAHATGELVAYTDSDVRVEPDWLTYLVQPLLRSDVVACGGPNVAPADDPWLARCVALSPGSPTQVMLDDRIAEHVPGCNMAFRRDALLAVNGFNPIYLRAGDDVDLCWRLQARGGKIGFSPAALVWHHHRPSIRAYWRQQKGYGEGEAWLLPHHPDKFVGGRVVWHGRIYSPLPFVRSLSGTRIDAGVWGTAAFPSVYHPGADPLTVLPHTAAWVGTSLALMMGGFTASLVTDMLFTSVVLALVGVAGLVISAAKCVRCAVATDIRALPQVPGRSPRVSRAIVRGVIAWLHFVQPLARQVGWFRGQFVAAEDVASHPAPGHSAPSRMPSAIDVIHAVRAMAGRSTEERFWGESCTSGEAVLTRLVKRLRGLRITRHIDVDDGWQLHRDVSVPIRSWGWLDLRGLVEDHGSDRRLLRLSHRLKLTPFGIVLFIGVGGGGPAAMALQTGFNWPALSLWAGLLACGCGMALWQVTRMISAVRHACVKAAEDVDMQPVLSSPPTPKRPRSAWGGRRGSGPTF